MKKLLAAVALSLPLSALAAPIEGVIAFVGTFTDNVTAGTGTLDFSNVIQWEAARTDDFTDLQGDFFNVAFGPINVVGGNVVTPETMWTLNDGFGVISSFVLENITAYSNNSAGVAVDGIGTLSLTGYDDTTGVFSLDTANNKLTFDADVAAVPAPDMVALLGLGLIGLGLARRGRKDV